MLDAALMRTPPSHYFYRLVAVNEAGRSDPSPIFPLCLPSMDNGGAPVDPGALRMTKIYGIRVSTIDSQLVFVHTRM